MAKSMVPGLVVAMSIAGIHASRAATPIYVYGPGGPAPAMAEAAQQFSAAHHVKVIVVAGPTPK